MRGALLKRNRKRGGYSYHKQSDDTVISSMTEVFEEQRMEHRKKKSCQISMDVVTEKGQSVSRRGLPIVYVKVSYPQKYYKRGRGNARWNGYRRQMKHNTRRGNIANKKEKYLMQEATIP